MKTLGIILILLGAAMFLIPGISFKIEEKLVDIGPIEINKTKNHNIDWPSYAGGVSIAAGLIFLVTGRKK